MKSSMKGIKFYIHTYIKYRVSKKTGISVQGSIKALKWPKITQKKNKETDLH